MTDSTEQSPFWGIDNHSGAQENPCLLWNRVHSSPPLDPILSHMHLINVPARIPYDLQITIHI
jgi:hypothetical protein